MSDENVRGIHPDFLDAVETMSNIAHALADAEDWIETLEKDFLIVMDLLSSCLDRMNPDERELTLILQEQWDGILDPQTGDWRSALKDLKGDQNE